MRRADFLYQPFYCEENIWQLCQAPPFKSASYACFIFNAAKLCPMFYQRAGEGPLGLVSWDYHVVLLASQEDSWRVYDLDSILPFPIAIDDYLTSTFAANFPVEYQPQFRVIEAPTYVEQLCSDRSHMLDKNSNYIAPPPPWPCPANNRKGSGLLDFLNLEEAAPGSLYTLAALHRAFGL
jgi:protein N-terminal glutamine amidohydrolase